MKPPVPDPTTRFSDRVADYVRYRPGYPDEMVAALRDAVGLGEGSAVADLGAGTGISSELFLRVGCTVHAVEPNDAMREAAVARLGENPRFRAHPGTAEATGLPAASVDLVVAGQAFHWFDVAAARREALRILVPGGQGALFWNSRRSDATPFLRAYEALLRDFGTDYAQVTHRNVAERALAAFFGGPYESQIFANHQDFDAEGLRGRVLSSSYSPAPGHPRHIPMLAALADLFAAHEENGLVRFEYDTELFFGALPGE